MSALFTVFITLCSAGDHMISATQIYGSTATLLKHTIKRLGIDRDEPVRPAQGNRDGTQRRQKVAQSLARGGAVFVDPDPQPGQRVGRDADLDRLYRRFGAHLREHAAGYTVALLAARGPRIQELGLAGAEEDAVVNGGLDCRLLRTRLPDGYSA